MSFACLRRVPVPIGLRLTAYYSVVFVVSVVLVLAAAHVLMSASLRRMEHDAIRGELLEIAAHYHAGGLQAVSGLLAFQEGTGTSEPFIIRLTGADGSLLLTWRPPRWADVNLERLSQMPLTTSGQWTELASVDRRTRSLEVTATRLDDGTILEVGGSSDDRQQIMRGFRRVAGLMLVPVMVLGVGGGMLLAASALRPIRQIVEGVRAVAAGAVHTRVPVRETNDELGELSRLFNDMLERIAALVDGMRAALDNVAHDLRTPIMRIRGTAELALRSGESLQDVREALAECVEESDGLRALLNTLMDISEAESAALRLHMEPVDVASALREVADLYADVAEDNGVMLAPRAPQEIWVTADRQRIHQVLANLVDNALKYTPAGGRVDLLVDRAEQAVLVKVRDTGMGITPDELPRIWERLYRGDRSRSTRGLGLGLSLVRAVVRAHGGEVTVSSAVGKGSEFTVILPLASSHPHPRFHGCNLPASSL
jgi:signal transduction histidine kinase